MSVYFCAGVRCAPAFFERCGRFTKNCVCSRLHSPQRLTRLCGCCDEPHFCFRKNGFHESRITAKKRTRPVRVCPYIFVRGTLRFTKLRPLTRCPKFFAYSRLRGRKKFLFPPFRRTPFFAFAKTGFMNPCITAKKTDTTRSGVSGTTFCQGYGALPHFSNARGRFTKNCVCSRLHSPQRLTRLCGCCDEPHSSLSQKRFHESLYHSQKKRTRPVRVCPFLAAIQGFEPRQAESEAAVLPLHYIAIPRLYIKPLYYTTFRKFVKGDKC